MWSKYLQYYTNMTAKKTLENGWNWFDKVVGGCAINCNASISWNGESTIGKLSAVGNVSIIGNVKLSVVENVSVVGNVIFIIGKLYVVGNLDLISWKESSIIGKLESIICKELLEKEW